MRSASSYLHLYPRSEKFSSFVSFHHFANFIFLFMHPPSSFSIPPLHPSFLGLVVFSSLYLTIPILLDLSFETSLSFPSLLFHPSSSPPSSVFQTKQGFTRRRPRLSYKTVNETFKNLPCHIQSPSSSFFTSPISTLLSFFTVSISSLPPLMFAFLLPSLHLTQSLSAFAKSWTANPGLKVKQVTDWAFPCVSYCFYCLQNEKIIQ